VVDASEMAIDCPKKQKEFYSGKKNRHKTKAQLIIHYETKQIISAAITYGSVHDFQLFKKQRYKALMLTDKGYQGLNRLGVSFYFPSTPARRNH